MPRLTFEDFKPGTAMTYGRYAVTLDEIRAYASEYDPQPMHLDAVAAQRTAGRWNMLMPPWWSGTARAQLWLLLDEEELAGVQHGPEHVPTVGGVGVVSDGLEQRMFLRCGLAA